MLALVTAVSVLLGGPVMDAPPAFSTFGVLQPECVVSPRMALEGRPSPLDSVSFTVGGRTVKICYGAPSARGRVMIGGEDVPYGQLWRTGANEPTMIHTTTALDIAGIHVPAGTYSLYTVPGEREWEIIVNRATDQWGHERMYTDEVRAQEVGRARVPAQRIDNHVERFTIRAEPDGANAVVILEWEHTRIRIPFRAH